MIRASAEAESGLVQVRRVPTAIVVLAAANVAFSAVFGVAKSPAGDVGLVAIVFLTVLFALSYTPWFPDKWRGTFVLTVWPLIVGAIAIALSEKSNPSLLQAVGAVIAIVAYIGLQLFSSDAELRRAVRVVDASSPLVNAAGAEPAVGNSVRVTSLHANGDATGLRLERGELVTATVLFTGFLSVAVLPWIARGDARLAWRSSLPEGLVLSVVTASSLFCFLLAGWLARAQRGRLDTRRDRLASALGISIGAMLMFAYWLFMVRS